MSLIQIKNLSKTYFGNDKKVEVLKNLSLEVSEGEVLNVLGMSGAGKSTLLHIIGALDRPTSGSVLFDGADIFGMGDGELARFRNEKVGFVFQFHHLLPEFTALENTMMPGLIAGWAKGRAEGRAREILSSLGLAHREHHKPGELSGGEQQRVAVGRAIFLAPRLLLADEPTGNLDTKTGEEVHEILMDLNRTLKITMVIVTHNLALAEKRGLRVFLKDGKIAGY